MKTKLTFTIDEVIDGPFPGMFAIMEPVVSIHANRLQHAHRLVAWLSTDGSKCAVVGRSLSQPCRKDDVEKSIKHTVAMASMSARRAAYDQIAESHADALYAAIMALPKSRREELLDAGEFDDWSHSSAEEQAATQRHLIVEALGYAIRYGHFCDNDLPEHQRDAFVMATKFQSEFSGVIRLDKSFIDIFDAAAKAVTPDMGDISTWDEDSFVASALAVEDRWLRRAGGARLYVKAIHESAESLAAECRSMTGSEISPPSP